MVSRNILIVDDEKSILTILKNGLQKAFVNYQIDAVTSGFAALRLIRHKTYSLVITDYRMEGMDGLEFLKTIRILQPKTKVILMTGYGSPHIRAEAERVHVFKYLLKPIEITDLRNIVQEALGGTAANPQMIRVLTPDQQKKSEQLMQQLKSEIGSRCVFITDLSGQIYSQVGDINMPHLEEIVTLLSSSIAALLEAGIILADSPDITGLIYFKAGITNLCAINIGLDMFLVIVSDSKFVNNSIGLILHFAQRVADILAGVMEEANFVPLQEVLNEELRADLGNELDKLFDF